MTPNNAYRTKQIALLHLQCDRLYEFYVSSGSINRALYLRVKDSLFKINSKMPMQIYDKERLVSRIAEASDENMIVNLQGGKVYVYGYIDIKKLREHVLW